MGRYRLNIVEPPISYRYLSNDFKDIPLILADIDKLSKEMNEREILYTTESLFEKPEEPTEFDVNSLLNLDSDQLSDLPVTYNFNIPVLTNVSNEVIDTPSVSPRFEITTDSHIFNNTYINLFRLMSNLSTLNQTIKISSYKRRIKCCYDNCHLMARYGFIYNLQPLVCHNHLSNNMVMCTNNKCEVKDCMSEPTHGYFRDRILRSCEKHNKHYMSFVKIKCEYFGCTNQPIYMILGHPKKMRCVNHRNEMCVYSKDNCDYPKCIRIATYGDPKDGIKIRCSLHRQQHHTNVVMNICLHPSCYATATHGLKEDCIRKTCKNHAKCTYVRVY